MKLRAIVLALASATLPHSAQAADDFCSRMIVQAVSQFCQLLPNGLNLCQPVALVGPGPECATPGRQALVPVGPPTVQPPSPWTASASPLAAQAAPAPSLSPDLPRIMAEAPNPAAPASTAMPPIETPAHAATPTPEALPSAPPVVATLTPPSVPQAAPASPPASAIAPADAATTVDALAHFDFDSAKLTSAGRAVLDAWLLEVPRNKTVRVSGHTDRLGPKPYNLKLSLHRAEAVKQYLVSKGVNPRRIQIEAKGEAEPVKRCKGGATPATKACLAPNRRAVIDPE